MSAFSRRQIAVPRSRSGAVREDDEDERRGTANLFLWYQPLNGKRHVEATDQRRRPDWAHCIKDLIDVHYPDAEKIVLSIQWELS